MSRAEIAHRLGERARRELSKHTLGRFQSALSASGDLPVVPSLRDGLRNWQVPDPLLLEWEDAARGAASGEPYLLGRHWPACPLDRRWSLDPVSGGFWPATAFCFDIDFRSQRRLGDVKYVWELNRLQYLQPIAALALVREDSELAALCLAHLESWIDNNPPGRGVAWASGIELALRVVSMMLVTTLLAEHFSRELQVKTLRSLQAHALWIARFPSRFSSANNHRTAEGLGLFLVGSLCPQFVGSGSWRRIGWDILCEASREQILPDGVGAEQSIAYSAIVLEMLLLGLTAAQRTGVAVPPTYLDKVTLLGEYLRWCTDAEGNQPHIGDDDSGRVLGAYHPDETYVRSVLGSLAAMTGQPDLVPPGVPSHLRQAIFGLPPCAPAGPMGLRTFGDGGYTVGRHTMAGRKVLLVIDHGHLGYLAIAAHGHADALSVWLHLDNQPILVDAGTYLYHSGGEWRQHFRGTATHNTLSVRGADSSVMAGNFNWSRKAAARRVAGGSGNDGWWIEAEHDGFAARFGAIHQRRLEVDYRNRVVTIRDVIRGTARLAVEVGFLLHPALSARLDGDRTAIGKSGRTLVYVSSRGELRQSIRGHEVPGGWYSPTFGLKYPTTRLCYEGTLYPGQEQVTRFELVQDPVKL